MPLDRLLSPLNLSVLNVEDKILYNFLQILGIITKKKKKNPTAWQMGGTQ